MAYVAVGNHLDFDMRDLNFAKLYYGSSYNRTNSLFRVNYSNGGKDEFRGSGFNYDASGVPTDGTVKSYGAYDNVGRIVFVSGLDVGAAKIVNAAKTAGKSDDRRIMSSELSGNDKFVGGNQDDVLFAYDGNDTMNGGSGRDRLYGGDGRDRLTGGLGGDALIGGDGPDTFLFKGVEDSIGDDRDKIIDFSRFQKDKLDLSSIDANGDADGSVAFQFIGTQAFSGQSGELRYERVDNVTVVEGDINGDGIADLAIEVADSINLRASDFLL